MCFHERKNLNRYGCSTSICQMNGTLSLYTLHWSHIVKPLLWSFSCVFLKERQTEYMSEVQLYVIGIYVSIQIPQTLQNASFDYMLMYML